MTLNDITDRSQVEAAMAEYDELGQEAFLPKYGFGQAKAYWLVVNGKRYDSKAILGVAHKFARPELGALTADAFSGGNLTVKRKLEALGFSVETTSAPTAGGPSAFLMTWKASGWPHANIVRMRQAFLKDGAVGEPWRISSHKRAQVGDSVWLLKQGTGPKGIFGYGRITRPADLGDAGNGKQQMMVNVAFSRFVDPEEGFLIDEATTRRVLSDKQMRAQASGNGISDEQSAQLAALLGVAGTGSHHKLIEQGEADETQFDASSLEDAKDRIIAAIVRRRGQRKFRQDLIAAYGGRCAISGCSVLDVLEAAHIYPYRGPKTNVVQNGLLLRADLHTLFDLGLINVEPLGLTVVVGPELTGSDYEHFSGVKLRDTTVPAQAPSPDALAQRTKSS